MIWSSLRESIRLFQRTPVLYLPDAVFTGIYWLLLYFVYLYTGAADILPIFQSVESARPTH